jgi:hypothetical protein
MSDVIAAALIAGLVGLGGTVVTLVVTRWNLKDQSRQSAEAGADSARHDRAEHYAQLAWQLHRLNKYATLGFEQSKADWSDWLDHYAHLRGVVRIVGARDVVGALAEFHRALEEAAPDLSAAFAVGEEIKLVSAEVETQLCVAQRLARLFHHTRREPGQSLCPSFLR